MTDTCSVKVAVRVRPLVPNEIQNGSREILDVIDENNQIVIKHLDKSFSFNYVLSATAQQDELYDRCVKSLIDNLFKGYNVTILAYGQTGSGKTHSMGTAYKDGANDVGVIPRAVNDIFTFIRDNFTLDFNVTVSFIELYQETLYDLLSNKSKDQNTLFIREDNVKGIHIPRLCELPVKSVNDVLNALERGSLNRATGSTQMNSQSSRSHAVFTINIFMQDKQNCQENKTAKLHLVDLAGSERQKKTGATGTTFKEGVNINKGLFVLGNVISCLGDDNKTTNSHVPYRDSILTRLLKDSLGGNSITLMIACVSPADYNLEETLSTLRYADRARKIKNKPTVNQDAKMAEINELKKQINLLKLQIAGDGGPMVCPAEVELLKKEINDLKVKSRELTVKLSVALRDNANYLEKFFLLQSLNEESNNKIVSVKEQFDSVLDDLIKYENDVERIKEPLKKLKDIQNQLVSITNGQNEMETEIRQCEESVVQELSAVTSTDLIELEPEIQEQQEVHAEQQVRLDQELKEISHKLLVKASLAKQLSNNVQQMVDMEAIAENESKILLLQQEKDDLLKQLKLYQSSNVAVSSQTNNKLIDQRKRKRVQELEVQIQELTKKLQEQNRLIKLKEKDEQRINKLNKEILEMKQARVKMLRNIRAESDKFHKWKIQRERELARLKSEDRKKQHQIVQMRAIHDKQQNVFKRKVEEAAAINKRLRDALAVRQAAQESKLHTGKLEKMGQWLKQEFNVHIGVVEAKATLESLLEDRALLQRHLDELKVSPETADSSECKTLTDDIEIRSLQIQDLQQKILDSDEDNKSRVRFDNIQTMQEAKYALKLLFEQSAAVIKQDVHNQSTINELRETQAETAKEIESLKQIMNRMKEQHAFEISQFQQTYEEKIAVLLSQLRGVEIGNADEALKARCNIQQEKICELEKSLEDAKQENEKLNGKLVEIASELQKNQVSEKISNADGPQIKSEDSSNTSFSPLKPHNIDTTFCIEGTPQAKVPRVLQKDEGKDKIDFQENLDTSFEDDDIIHDPDWRKTPLGKRLQIEKRMIQRLSTKRSSEGGCTCRGKCGARCSCVKLKKACSNDCRCKVEVCMNQTVISNEDTSEDNGDDPTLNVFKKPKYFEDGDGGSSKLPQRKRRTRMFFE